MPKTTLQSHCVFIEGAKRGAIYNLKDGNIYSVNEDAVSILTQKTEGSASWKELVGLGLATSVLSQKPFALPLVKTTLRFMWLELTQTCNLNCVHCYGSFGSPKADECELDWLYVLSQGAAIGCKKVQFIGGEPLLYKGLKCLISYAKWLGCSFIEVFTNGTLMDEGWAAFFMSNDVRLAVSLYSYDDRIHDAVTQVQGSCAKTKRALELARKYKIPTRVAVIAMRANQETLEQTCLEARSCGFKTRPPDVLRPSGRGADYSLLPGKDVVAKYAMRSKPNFRTSSDGFAKSVSWNNCWLGKLAVSSSGDVYPCIFARNHVVGTLRKSSLAEAVGGNELSKLWGLTLDQVEVCKDCEYRYCCHNCRPLSEATFGDLYAKNPRCTYNPKLGTWGKD